jgi:hypothetical protein
LPTLKLRDLTAAEHSALYARIRQGTRLAGSDATFWDEEQGRDRKLHEVSNAPELVNTERAAPFHFTLQGASALGTELPVLGVHVFQDTIAIDYRMGPDWHAAQAFAFFAWLAGLLSGTRQATLALDESEAHRIPMRSKQPGSSFSSGWRGAMWAESELNMLIRRPSGPARAAHLGALAMGNARNRNRNHPRLETRRTGLAAS